jgi:cobalt-zinc-cadmium efflux system outer membrane protein
MATRVLTAFSPRVLRSGLPSGLANVLSFALPLVLPFVLPFALSLPLAAPALAQTPLTTAEFGRATHEVTAGSPDPAAANTVSLEDVLGLAAERNPLLRGARSEADASAGALMQAGVFPNPELSLLQEGFRGNERTSTALLNQKVELGNKRGARLDIAGYGRDVALASLDGRAAALRADVIAAFYGLLAAQWQLQTMHDSAAIAAKSADLAQRRARAGKVSPVEALKAKVAATSVEIELATLQARIGTAHERLVAVSGSPALLNRAAGGDLETLPAVPPLPQLLQHLDDSPISRRARAEMFRSSAVVALENARRIPDITVTAGAKRIVTGGVNDNQAVIGISIPLPLFDTNKGAILEAAHKADKASADLDSENAQLRLDLTQAYANYDSSTQEARRLKRDVLPAAREALDAMTRGVELGKFSVLDVLDTQRTLFQIRSQYLQALIRSYQAYADLGRLTGTPLRADLSRTNPLP